MVARLKITVSFPQSRHDTFTNPPGIHNTSLVDELEPLGTLTWCIVCLAGLSTSEQDIDPLGRLLSTIGLWTGETAVSRSDPSEAALAPLQFAGTLLLDALHDMHGVTARRWAVALDLPWHLYHNIHLERASHKGPVYMGAGV